MPLRRIAEVGLASILPALLLSLTDLSNLSMVLAAMLLDITIISRSIHRLLEVDRYS